jgi:hypothetical protein
MLSVDARDLLEFGAGHGAPPRLARLVDVALEPTRLRLVSGTEQQHRVRLVG